MKLDINRYSMRIVPENPQDEAYLEEVIGAKLTNDQSVTRVLSHGSLPSSFYALEIIKKSDNKADV